MRFGELKEQVKSVGLNELRKDIDNYFEAVVAQDKIKELNCKLNDFFGEPVWPSRKKLSLETEKAIEGYGGIIEGQILYSFNLGGANIYAMLWPWQNGESTTVKIIRR